MTANENFARIYFPLFKDIHRENAFTNKLQALTKSMNRLLVQ